LGADKPNVNRFRWGANRFVFVETFADLKTFGALIVVYAKDSSIGLRSIKNDLKIDTDKLGRRLTDRWVRWFIENPLQFSMAK
jgi:hypothetical protein